MVLSRNVDSHGNMRAATKAVMDRTVNCANGWFWNNIERASSISFSWLKSAPTYTVLEATFGSSLINDKVA